MPIAEASIKVFARNISHSRLVEQARKHMPEHSDIVPNVSATTHRTVDNLLLPLFHHLVNYSPNMHCFLMLVAFRNNLTTSI